MLPDLNTLFIFVAATLALNITPGPDMLYVIARSVGQGRTAGLLSALGIGVGSLVHTAAVVLGLSALLRSQPAAYEVIKYLGAAYLVYLGVRTLAEPHIIASQAARSDRSMWKVFAQGIVINVLNPKVALFFLAFLPQFTDDARGPIAPQMAVLGLVFVVSGTLVNGLVALLASTVGTRLLTRPGFAKAQRYFTGTVFLLLAARLAISERT